MVNFNQIALEDPGTQRLDSYWKAPYSVILGNNNDSIHRVFLNVRIKEVHTAIFRGNKKRNGLRPLNTEG